MSKRKKITATSDRTVTVQFGKAKPSFNELAEIAHRHGLTEYVVNVYNSDSGYTYGGPFSDYGPRWVARFSRQETLE